MTTETDQHRPAQTSTDQQTIGVEAIGDVITRFILRGHAKLGKKNMFQVQEC